MVERPGRHPRGGRTRRRTPARPHRRPTTPPRIGGMRAPRPCTTTHAGGWTPECRQWTSHRRRVDDPWAAQPYPLDHMTAGAPTRATSPVSPTGSAERTPPPPPSTSVDRGPHSHEALEWRERRFEAVVFGGHERPWLDWFSSRRRPAPPPTPPPEWRWRVPSSHHRRCHTAVARTPCAATVETAHQPLGLVHPRRRKALWPCPSSEARAPARALASSGAPQ